MEVEEAITAITWQPPQGKYLKLLTTNSRSIKSWKIYEKAEKKVAKSAGKELTMPKLQPTDSYFAAKLQYTFPLKHHSSINSISTSGNEEYLLSSDDFHCLLWSYERPDKPFQLADLLGKEKPEDVEETITFSKMHPTSDSMFVYGTNKGILKLCDLRQASNSDPTAAVFKSEYAGNKNFLASTLSSYSSADFTKQGKYVVSRDYLTAKIWDVCNTKKPVISVPLNDGFKGKLS